MEPAWLPSAECGLQTSCGTLAVIHRSFHRPAVLDPHTHVRRCSRQLLPGLRLPRITATFVNRAALDSRPCARLGSQEQ